MTFDFGLEGYSSTSLQGRSCLERRINFIAKSAS